MALERARTDNFFNSHGAPHLAFLPEAGFSRGHASAWTCPGDICLQHFRLSTLNSCSPAGDVPDGKAGFPLGRQVIDISAFPSKSLRLRETEMSQHAICELAGHFI